LTQEYRVLAFGRKAEKISVKKLGGRPSAMYIRALKNIKENRTHTQLIRMVKNHKRRTAMSTVD
jgi:hypothetical protein